MRQTETPTNPLGRIVWDFRGKFHLSKRAAASVLGVSYVYVNSLEAGVDVRTKLEFEPRDSTLEAMARRMVEYAEKEGQPLSKTPKQLFLELQAAAGKAAPEEKGAEAENEELQAAERLAKAAKSSFPAFAQATAEQQKPKGALLGLVNEFGQVEYPPTPQEQAIYDESMRLGFPGWPTLSEPGFWSKPPEDLLRRSTFRNIEAAVDDARAFYGENGGS
jgi:hypothetical protein